MSKWETKRRKRSEAANRKDLRLEKVKLEYLRDTRHIFDSLAYYLHQPHLTTADRDEIRQCMRFLTRG